MPEISIIVPVFQSEKYLEECLNSILSQTFTDFELLLIDDGSTDGSADICDKYAIKYDRVISVHQSNSGVSSARNKGISLAKGKYIMFCDSDDYVDKSWCEVLYKSAQQNPYHFITCDCERISSNGDLIRSTTKTIETLNIQSYFDLWKLGLSAYVTTKIYQKEILLKHNILFREDINFAEDVAFNVEYFGACSGIIVIPNRLYYYRDNPTSLMHKKYDNFFPVFSFPFSVRLPLILEHQLGEYCNFWLADFINMFDYIFTRNDLTITKKLRYNQEILCSKEFQFCLKHATGREKSSLSLSILKTGNYYLFWFFNKVRSFKNTFFQSSNS